MFFRRMALGDMITVGSLSAPKWYLRRSFFRDRDEVKADANNSLGTYSEKIKRLKKLN
jgi:hypothetical protein